MLDGQVLGGDAHVADAERVGQHGDHHVDGLGIAHAGTGTQGRHHVGAARHDFDTTAYAIVAIAQHDAAGQS